MIQVALLIDESQNNLRRLNNIIMKSKRKSIIILSLIIISMIYFSLTAFSE